MRTQAPFQSSSQRVEGLSQEQLSLYVLSSRLLETFGNSSARLEIPTTFSVRLGWSRSFLPCICSTFRGVQRDRLLIRSTGQAVDAAEGEGSSGVSHIPAAGHLQKFVTNTQNESSFSLDIPAFWHFLCSPWRFTVLFQTHVGNHSAGYMILNLN